MDHRLCCTGRNTTVRLVYSSCHPSVSCLVKQKEKILLHHPHHINQAWKHNGKDLTEGNQGQGQTYEILLSFIPPPSVSFTLSVCWPISGADPKRLEKRTAPTYCQPHTPLSPSRSAATRGLGSCFPEVIISQHISQARLISARSQIVQGSSPLRQGCSHSLYSTTDRKTIDECTLNVTPVPPGREGDLKNWWSISIRSKNYRYSMCFWTDYNTPWGYRWTKGESVYSVSHCCFMLHHVCCLLSLCCS